MTLEYKVGSTDVSINVFIQDSSVTTGAGLTGLVYNSAGLTAYYVINNGTPTAISLATLASATAAHSDGGFIAREGTNQPGLYRLDLPDAVLATVGSVVVYLKGATNMAPVPKEFQVKANIASDIIALLPTALVGGRMVCDVTAISGDSTAADNAEAFFDGTGYAGTNNVIPTVTTVTTTTNLTNLPTIPNNWITAAGINADAFTAAKFAADVTTELQSGLATASALSTMQGNVTSILADTNELQTDWANGGRLDNILDTRSSQTSVDDLPTNAELATALAGADDAVLAAVAALNNITAADVWAAGTRTLTAGTNIVLAKGTGITGFNDLSAAQVNAEADAALSDVGLTTTITGRIDAAVSSRLSTAGYTAPDNASIAAILLDTAEIGAAGVGLTALASAADLSTLDTVADAIKVVTDKLDDTLELDSTVYRFTTNALEQAPSGGGGGGASAADIWAYDISAVSTGAAAVLKDRASQTSVDAIGTDVDAILVDTGTSIPASLSSLDGKVDDIKTVVDNIALDTADIGVNGAGLTSIPWNPAWDAEVQSEVSDALIAYDPPTKAEMDTALGDLPTATECAEALLKIDMSTITGEASRSPLNALRILRNKVSTSTGILTVTKENDSTTAWTATLSTDAAAEPIIGIDPA